MQIVCISRGSFEYSKNLAERLASKMGAPCISREEITDKASDFGIPVGKLEVAILKRRPLSEAMAIEVDMFKAFVTATLCERALTGSIVYHGRTGHLVLPNLGNVLRVRAIADMEVRIAAAMERMGLSHEKARQFNQDVDEDIRRWVRQLYNVEWEDPSLYDVVVNATHLSVENASSVLLSTAQLPDFQTTPASQRALRDLLLASRCRMAIGMAKETQDLKVKIQADRGQVSVTFPPSQERQAQHIPEVLENVEGIGSLVCTTASSNILYIGETFKSDAPEFLHLVEIAEKWNAAVDVVRLTEEAEAEAAAPAVEPGLAERREQEDGGILEDTGEAEKAAPPEDSGLSQVMDHLIQVGRAGKSRVLTGQTSGLARKIPRDGGYNLIVVGDVFSTKALAQTRLKRDLISTLTDKFRTPVIGTEDLKSQYLFGPKQLVSLLGNLALSALIYILVMVNQGPILKFISAGQHEAGFLTKALATAFIVVMSPLVAFAVGGFYKNLLKLVKIE